MQDNKKEKESKTLTFKYMSQVNRPSLLISWRFLPSIVFLFFHFFICFHFLITTYYLNGQYSQCFEIDCDSYAAIRMLTIAERRRAGASSSRSSLHYGRTAEHFSLLTAL